MGKLQKVDTTSDKFLGVPGNRLGQVMEKDLLGFPYNCITFFVVFGNIF